MNNIIPVSRLGELLSAKTGADVDACTKFVKEYFGLIEATLSAGEDVTIKGIGTFKLTGDETDPVIYQVDPDLASTVNAPFEAFTAFELTDSELTETAIEPEPEPEPEITETSETSDPQPQPEPEPQLEIEPSEISEISDPETEPEQEPELEPEQEPEQEPQPNTDLFPKGLKIFWFVLVFILGLLLGLAGGYFGHNYITGMLANMPEEVVAAEPTDSIAEAADSMESLEIADAPDATEKQEVVEATEVAPAPKEPRYDTITGTCYLTTLARKYYGNMDFWVYIYDANNLGNPNRITPGTKVRIPYPEELNLNSDNTSALKAAKQRASEIYAKYK